MRPDFLIVGMERSGTHWVAGLLNAHKDIAAFPSLPFREEEGGNKIGEVHFFDTLASVDGERPEIFTRPVDEWLVKYNKIFADLVAYKDKISREDFVAKSVKRYGEYCDSQRGDKKIVGEGSPSYIFHLDFIDTIYPGIKKICSIRDPKDKIVSWYFNKKVRKGDERTPHISEEFAMDYLKHRIIKEYEALLEYKGDVHCITYERMSNKTADTARGMVLYLGFKVTDNELTYMVNEAAFERQTERDGGQKRVQGQEDPKSGLRKGIVGDWKNHLSKPLAEKIDNATGDLRKRVFKKYHVKL